MADYVIAIIIGIIFSVGVGVFFVWHRKNKNLLSLKEKELIREYRKKGKSLSKVDIGWILGVNFLFLFIVQVVGSLKLGIIFFLFAIGIILVFFNPNTYQAFSKMGISESYLKKDRFLVYIFALFTNLLGLISLLFYIY